MSTSALHNLSIVKETTYGVTPDNPAFLRKDFTGTTIALTKGIIESETIRPNRQLSDVRHGTRQIGGDISVELNYGGYADFLEAVMCGTWTARIPNKTASTLSAAAADNSINDSANGLPEYEVGELVTISGFTGTVGNNQTGIVVSSTNSKLVLTTDDPLVNDAAGEAVTLALPLSVLVPGSVRRSYSILRHFSDLAGGANPFHLYKGCQFNTMSLAMTTEAFVKGTFGVLGSECTQASTAPTGATFTDQSADKYFDSFSGFLKVDGVDNAEVTEMMIELENGMEPRFALFRDTSGEAKIGKTRIKGSLTLYFRDSEMFSAFNGGLKKDLEFQLEDVDGNTLTFSLPNVLPTGADAPAQGEADIFITMPFTATYDLDGDKPEAMKITRVAA